MDLLYFVTPAWQRTQLSEVVFDQRLHAIRWLSRKGVEARCVVIADDQNAELAYARGFDVLIHPNYQLGRKFNDGIEHAAKAGADWIIPIGSDSFLDPAYLYPLPQPGTLRTSTRYAVAKADRVAPLVINDPRGVGPFMIPPAALPESLRPAGDHLHRGVDTSTIKGLLPVDTEYVDLHPWQYVGFRSSPQITPYEKLFRTYGTGEETEVLAILSEHYPAPLVQRAVDACRALPSLGIKYRAPSRAVRYRAMDTGRKGMGAGSSGK